MRPLKTQLTFGDLPVNQSKQMSLKVWNSAVSTASNLRLSLPTNIPAGFKATLDKDKLTPGEFATLTVTFEALESKSYNPTFDLGLIGGQSNKLSISLSGKGVKPAIEIVGNNKLISNGITTTDTGIGTKFELSAGNTTKTNTFKIKNSGEAPLKLNGSPRVKITGIYANLFEVEKPASSKHCPWTRGDF